ncbi:MAG: ATP-binding protein, partial [Bythopirellula sp.]
AQVGVTMGLTSGEGKRQIFNVNCNPVMGAEGQYRGVLTSFDDVTMLEETKVELAESKVAAESANRAKSEFLARMSHEIRTPMNAILGFTDVLRRGIDVDEAERLDYLSTIHTSGQHLLSLINDILDLSKVEAGKLELELQSCSPLEIVAEVVDVMRARAEEKEIQLSYESDGPVPATIQSDPTRLRQIVTNLVGNALKFTDQGGVCVSVRLANTNNGPRLQCAVRDTGVGMPQTALDKIFDPFSQADESVTRKFGGTGLGLSICKRFTEALGGELTVTSQLGKGSVFTATLATGSLDGVDSITADQLRSTMRPAPTKLNTLQLPPSRILVADDAEANRKLMQLVLTRAGVTVDLAENGQVALERAAEHRYDIVLMDMQMPVMDGATATRRLREAGFTRPIIALTADAMKGSEQKCREAGCSGFLTKPVDMDRLISTLAAELPDGDDQAARESQPRDTATKPRDATADQSERSTVVPSPTAQVDPAPTTEVKPNEKLATPVPADADNVARDALQQVQQMSSELQASVARRDTKTMVSSTSETQPVSLPPTTSPSASSGDPIHSSLPTEDPELRSIVLGWTDRLNSQLAEIHTAAEAHNYQELAGLAHWLKGSAGTVGFGDFTEPAKALQLAADQENSEQIANQLLVLDDLAARVAAPVG